MGIFSTTVLIISSKSGVVSLGTKLFSSKERAKEFAKYYLEKENFELTAAPEEDNNIYYTGDKSVGDENFQILIMLQKQEVLD